MKFSTLWWGTVSVHSGLAILSSKYYCSNSFGFRETAFSIKINSHFIIAQFLLVFVIWRFLRLHCFFFKKLRLTEFESRNDMVVCC